ncbi:MAG: hypothetical protein H7282_05155 [Cytophagaceae bacterium]|nr:hypothetical protein [Cytophagaceae bacterium]
MAKKEEYKYVLKCRCTGAWTPEEVDLDHWTDKDFEKMEAGDKALESEARGVAIDTLGFEYWVEKVEK